MKSRLASLFVCAVLALFGASASAKPDERQERLDASFLLSQGRLPTDEERQAWAGAEENAFGALLVRHRERLRDDAAAQRALAVRAALDAFGTETTPSGFDAANPTAGETYAELVQRHLGWLSSHPDAYRQVVDRAYRLAVGREAFPIEQDYWKERATLSFAMLVGCADSWARRNAPGLMATTGTPSISINCGYLTTRRLSPAVAAEVRAASGPAPVGEPALALACDRNVIAPGAGEIVSIGGIHLVAVGGAGLRGK
jgi:hypothetical protein